MLVWWWNPSIVPLRFSVQPCSSNHYQYSAITTELLTTPVLCATHESMQVATTQACFWKREPFFFAEMHGGTSNTAGATKRQHRETNKIQPVTSKTCPSERKNNNKNTHTKKSISDICNKLTFISEKVLIISFQFRVMLAQHGPKLQTKSPLLLHCSRTDCHIRAVQIVVA